ncbi:MAG: hypothetical protein ACI4OI_08110 [Gemmiger sp.]
MTKNNTPSLFAALLAGLLSNVLLREQTAFWTRTGAIMAPFSVLVLVCTGWAFARCWRAWPNALFRGFFAVLLLFSSVLELLRLWRLSSRLYPDTVTLTAVCLMTLLPVIYLRRVSAIAQTANVLVCLLAVSAVLLLVSIAPRLRVVNLQMPALTWSTLCPAAEGQIILYPEYLLPALWPEQDKRGEHTLLRLSGWAIGMDVGAHLVLELFFGAAMPGQADPIHAVARCGALSIFNRLEWLQILLWSMAVSLKLALYLYAVFRLFNLPGAKANTAVGLNRFPLYFGGMLLLCVVLRKLDTAQALAARNVACWGLAVWVWIGGGIACLASKKRRR